MPKSVLDKRRSIFSPPTCLLDWKLVPIFSTLTSTTIRNGWTIGTLNTKRKKFRSTCEREPLMGSLFWRETSTAVGARLCTTCAVDSWVNWSLVQRPTLNTSLPKGVRDVTVREGSNGVLSWLPTFGCVHPDGTPTETLFTPPGEQGKPKTLDYIFSNLQRIGEAETVSFSAKGMPFQQVSDHHGVLVSLLVP